MFRKHLVPFVVLFLLGALVFFLPIREHDYLRLRYFIGLWFFAEAAFLVAQGENRATPLYSLVWRFRLVRDKLVAGSALAALFVILYLSVWFLMDHAFAPGVKLALAVGTILGCWLIYYGSCFLLGSEELREAVMPKFPGFKSKKTKR